MKEKSKEREEQPLALHASRTFRAAAKREIGIDFEIARSLAKKVRKCHMSAVIISLVLLALCRFPKLLRRTLQSYNPLP